MSDLVQMENMLSSAPPRELLFKDSQVETQQDINNGQYSSGQVNFDDLQLVSKQITKRDNVLQIASTISIDYTQALGANNCLGTIANADNTNPLGANTNIIGVNDIPSFGGVANLGSQGSVAVRSSILDLVTGIYLGLSDNTAVISETGGSNWFINYMKILIQNDDEWLKTFGPELMIAKDTNTTCANNSGFNQRQAYLLNQSNVTYYTLNGAVGATATGYISKIQTLFNIPLKYLHSIYDNMDSPQKGIRWMSSFFLCKEFNPASTFSGFHFATAAPPNVSFKIGATVGGITYNGCSIKYRSIDLPDNVQEEVSKLTLSGALKKRKIRYALTELYQGGNGLVNQTSALTSFQVSNGLVNGIRLWFFGCPTGNLFNNIMTNATAMGLSSLNIRINNTNRFNAPLNDPYTMWEQVKDQMECVGRSPDKGSLINYNDFLNPSGRVAANQLKTTTNVANGLYSWYCIDLARLQKRTQDQAITIILDTIRNDSAGAMDYFILIEREAACEFDFIENTAVVMIGSNL